MKQFPEENLPDDIQVIADRMNVDENNIPPCIIPELPFDENTSPAEFLHRIRPELVRTMGKYMYGEIPPRCEELRFEVTSENPAFDGLAIRREIDIICRHKGKSQTLHMLLYIPAERKGKVPVFFGLNFQGNHACTYDPGVTFYPFVRMPERFLARLSDRRAEINDRGVHAGRWEFEKVIKAGFAAATICYQEIFPDRFSGFDHSILRLFYSREEWLSPDRPTGAISAWAWGIFRGIDALEAQEELDMTCLCVHGHSRLGKTALWAGANDPRITITASNGAGCCGAKLIHHYYGENLEWMDLWNGFWYPARFAKYIQKDLEFPVDQHFLLAAIAPRMLFIGDSIEDVYADIHGEFMSMQAAEKAWNLFGITGLGDAEFPEVFGTAGDNNAFFLNAGGHDFTPETWDALLKFASKKFGKVQ